MFTTSSNIRPLKTFYLKYSLVKNLRSSFSYHRVQELVGNVPDEAKCVDLTICEGEPAQLLGDFDKDDSDNDNSEDK